MINYDFNTLFTPEEFENFGCDIVEIREKTLLERFNKYKDQGIDGRSYTNNKGDLLIIQCKREQNINKLIKDLETKEIKKVNKLNPKRYILVLSSKLTVNQKNKIENIFKNYIKSPNDIITYEDLQSYLRKKEYKNLFNYCNKISLTKNLDFNYLIETIKNPTLKSKSNFLIEEINKIKNYFVKTKTYKISYEYLIENHIVFLTGDAGSGKTTNAKMLLNQLYEEKYIDYLYKIDSCDELTNVIMSKNKIGILYDDFWGSTFEDLKLSLNNEKRLKELLDKIDEMDNVYFILTTREYVLNQGLSFYKDFNNKHLSRKIMHKNCNYTDTEKINILFSHAKNSNLDFNELHQIKYYAKKIINSRNYSPRSISYFIEKYQDLEEQKNFIETFITYLHNPYDFFKSIFYKLSEGSQILAFTLSISDPEITINYLKISFQEIAKNINSIKPSLFEEYLKELFDFFVENTHKRIDLIDFTNYSIFDFINNEFKEKIIDYEEAFCKGVTYFNQIKNLFQKFNISYNNQQILIEKLINNFDNLIITKDEDILIDIDDELSPQYYLSHKIWISLSIAKKTNSKTLKDFLYKRILNLIESYTDRCHFYENRNFIDIPEIIDLAEKTNIIFEKEKIVDLYLKNFCYLFELHYVNNFPKSYKLIIENKMETLGKKLKPNLEDRLIFELDLLSEEGITFEYDITLDELPKILKMLKIPKNKIIDQILSKYKYTPSTYNDYIPNDNKKSSKEVKIEKEINKFENDIFKINKITKTKLINMINQSNLNKNNKTLLKKELTNENNSLIYYEESSIEFVKLLLNYYTEEEKNDKKLTTSIEIYSYLLKNLEKKYNHNIIKFLITYAYDVITNDYNTMSLNHINKKYKIEITIINNLITDGVLNRNNNIIYFSDTNFQIFLSTEYLKYCKQTKELYINYCMRDGILNINEIYFLEKFNSYNFNNYFLIPTLEATIKNGIGNFKNIILDIDYDNETFLRSINEINLLNDFIEIYFEISINYQIEKLFTNNRKINILDFYNKNKNSLEHKEIDKICEDYFEFLKFLYTFLKNLKPNENFKVNKDENNNIILSKYTIKIL